MVAVPLITGAVPAEFLVDQLNQTIEAVNTAIAATANLGVNGLTITASTGTLTVPNSVTITLPATTGTAALASPPPVAAGATKTLTAANSGQTVLLNTAGGSVVTLPAATGTGNRFRFATTVTTTSAAHKILAVGTDYLIGMVNGVRTTALTPFLALVGSTYQSLQMPYAGSQPSGGIQGDWFEFEDVASGLWEVKGQFSAGTTATTPFNTATS